MQLTRAEVASSLSRFTRIAASVADHRAAAVAIIVVLDGNGDTGFLLTRRSAGLRAHAGQWALPGGGIEDGQNARQAACRELAEELGVTVDEADVVGALDDFVTRSGYCITPVVLWAADRQITIRPNEAEVAAVFVVPVTELAAPPRFLSADSSSNPIIQVPLVGSLVHAPTGAILHQFGEVVLHNRVTRVAHFEQPRFAWR